MKHHYLPKFYLKEFGDPIIPKGNPSFTHVYDLNERKWKQKSPKNIGCISDYYKFEADKDNPYCIEELYSRIENDASSIIRNKIKKHIELDSDEKKLMSLFIAVLLIRAPMARESVSNLISNISTILIEMVMTNERLFLNSVGPKLSAITPEINEEGIESVRKFLSEAVSDWNVKVNKDYLVGLLATPPLGLIKGLNDMHWSFLIAEKPFCFITSDCPCIKPGDMPKIDFVSFPVTSEIMLYAHKVNILKRYDVIPKDIVLQLNAMRLYHAQNFIVSCKPNFLGDQFLNDSTPKE